MKTAIPDEKKEKLVKLKEDLIKKEKELQKTTDEIEQIERIIDEDENQITPEDKNANLSSIVNKEEIELPPDDKQYSTNIAFDEIHNLYNQLKTISYVDNWDDNNLSDFYNASEQLNTIKEDLEGAHDLGYNISEDITNQLVASKSVEYNIRKYRKLKQ